MDNELAAMRVGYPQAGSESESVEDRMSAELDTSVVETGWLPSCANGSWTPSKLTRRSPTP